MASSVKRENKVRYSFYMDPLLYETLKVVHEKRDIGISFNKYCLSLLQGAVVQEIDLLKKMGFDVS